MKIIFVERVQKLTCTLQQRDKTRHYLQPQIGNEEKEYRRNQSKIFCKEIRLYKGKKYMRRTSHFVKRKM